MPPLQGVLRSGASSGGGGVTAFVFSRDFIANQNPGSASIRNFFHDDYGFDVAEGFGLAAASVGRDPFYIIPGPGADLEVEANLEFPVLADGHIGLIARLSGDSGIDESYYMGRITGQNLRISKVVNSGAVTTVAGDEPFTWAIGEQLNLKFTVVGSSLTLVAENLTTPDTAVLSGADTDIASGDCCGYRSGFDDAAVWWKDITVRQL